MTKTPPQEPPITTLFECIPNISEGRDSDLIEKVTELAGTCGVLVADATSDPDHNRSVLTWFGSREALLAACSAVLGLLKGERSLADHRGIHPRTGLLDVVPFVPLDCFKNSLRGETERSLAASSSTAHATRCAVDCAELLAREHHLPTFLYEHAATAPARRNLAAHRKALAPGSSRPWRCDFGPNTFSPRTGCVLVGARQPLVAFNLDLNSDDVRIARRIASRIRATGPEGLAGVKALGLFLASRGRAQVSVNLTDTRATSLPELVARVTHEAEALGTRVHSSELIGLLTEEATDGATASDLRLPALLETQFVEHHLRRLFPKQSETGKRNSLPMRRAPPANE